MTAYDSVIASRIPVIGLPEAYRGKMLPAVVDNSVLPCFPGIYNQYSFFSCQQYSGVSTTYAYEVNRLRNANGKLAANRYPAHYTWNFLNYGEQYTGVSFLNSFHALMQQGQMSQAYYGFDTAQQYLGWLSGYEKYESAFPNRILSMKSIPVDSEEGILTLKHYLHDHLDGSATGGVACFTSSGPSNVAIPPGLPEEGKHVVTSWNPWATHGMAIVGYNDSVRYDFNMDGQFTNDVDINGDGEVTAEDWEIGAFKLANSYGTWWADTGFVYVLYRAMAGQFELGGVWNQKVYIVEPDTAYAPLLGMKFRVKYNQRGLLRILAGVNTDTAAGLPSQILEFPFFNFQGGPHLMQGFDTIPGNEEIELGLDVTPLLGHVTPGQPARFFFIAEEEDPNYLGSGLIREVSFVNYTDQGNEMACPETDVPVLNQGTTYLSAVGSVSFSPPEIVTAVLPPCTPGQPYSVQLDADEGKEPYRWNLVENYRKSKAEPGYIGVTDTQLFQETDEILYARVPLPFSFPFFGKAYDTVFMNSRGMIQFTDDQIPYPYLIGSNEMLRNEPVIFPAFSNSHRFQSGEGDGMWVRVEPSSVTFRWKVSVYGYETGTDNSFELVLHSNGSFEFHYGPTNNISTADKVVSGYSKGDNVSYEIVPCDDLSSLTGNSVRYLPTPKPEGIALTENGLLTLASPSPVEIFDLTVRVTDERLLTAEKDYQLSTGLMIFPALQEPSGMAHFGEPQKVDLETLNAGQTGLDNLTLTLSCEDSLVQVSDSTLQAGSLAAGQTLTLPGAFTFGLQELLPDEYQLPLCITASSSSQTWTYHFLVTVEAPDIQLNRSEVNDGANHLLDPGEIADLDIEFVNIGSRDAENIHIAVSSDSTLTVLAPVTFDVPSLPSNEARSFPVRLQASRDIPVGSAKQVILTMTGDEGLEKEFTVDLQIGSKPVAIISLTSYTSSPDTIKSVFDTLGLAYDHYTQTINNLRNYPLLFLILGTHWGAHNLTDEESAFFCEYLNNGGKIYMETYNGWYYKITSITPKFHIGSETVPLYSFTEISGAPATSFEGLNFPYAGEYYQALYRMLPAEPGFSILNNTDTVPYPVQIAYDGNDYKTIGSIIEFGMLTDTDYPSAKISLMERYLDFFEVNFKGPYPYFHADSTATCRFHPVHFTDDSFDDIISREWEFPGGQPSSSTEQNPEVIYPDAGTYDVKLTVSDGISTHSLTRKEFIRIEVCAGETKVNPVSGVLVFPNPSCGIIRVKLPVNCTGQVQLALTDVTGNVLWQGMESPAQGELITIRLLDLASGFYFLRIGSDSVTLVKKIILSR